MFIFPARCRSCSTNNFCSRFGNIAPWYAEPGCVPICTGHGPVRSRRILHKKILCRFFLRKAAAGGDRILTQVCSRAELAGLHHFSSVPSYWGSGGGADSTMESCVSTPSGTLVSLLPRAKKPAAGAAEPLLPMFHVKQTDLRYGRGLLKSKFTLYPSGCGWSGKFLLHLPPVDIWRPPQPSASDPDCGKWCSETASHLL